jgi:hypothetical protein
MEVHSHTHTERKKWTHYLWEFLMLFLAVFCGFLAENLREHKIESDREKQFMQALIRDIKKDILQGDSLQIENLRSQKICDSLLVLLSGREIKKNSYPAYSLWSYVNGFIDFIPNDGTIQQLRNSGGLRLVRKQDVVDRLMEYTKVLELIKIHQAVMNMYLFQQSKKTELFDVVRLANENDSVNVPLLNNDKKLLGWSYEYIQVWRNLLDALNFYAEAAKTKGRNLLQSITKEYHLK